jgi:RNA polymerase sigma-70 factor (ECF subfamily)
MAHIGRGANCRDGTVAAAQRGDAVAFRELYARYFDRIAATANGYVRNRHDAEDVAQDVLVRLLRVLPTYRPEAGAFDGWLASIVRNQSLNHVRGRERAQLEGPEEMTHLRDAASMRAGTSAELTGFDRDIGPLVEQLPKQQRAVLLLTFGFGLTGKEAADLLGCTPECVRQSRHRALKSLEAQLPRSSTAPPPPARK